MGRNTQLKKEAIARSKGNERRTTAFLVLGSAAIAASVTSLVFIASTKNEATQSKETPTTADSQPSSLLLLDSLLAQPSVPANTDIALLNLATVPGPPPSERPRIIGDSLQTLDRWAQTVATETMRNRHRYLKNPDEFGSEAGWKMAMICSVLGQDFKVRYDPSLTSTTQQNASNDRFFANPESVFLTGCLGESRIGTCSSLPVLYVAVGRRLGYPMHLVAAKGHLFARWDDGEGTKINLEASNAGGYTSHPDSHYRKWPHPISPEEEKRGGYLRNLTPEETLAIFLSTRAACLQSKRKIADAIVASAAAFRLAPNLAGIAPSLRSAIGTSSPDHKMQQIIHQQELARLREQYDPMTPRPGIVMPHRPGVYSPSMPQAGIPQPNSFQNPDSGFPQHSNPHIPR